MLSTRDFVVPDAGDSRSSRAERAALPLVPVDLVIAPGRTLVEVLLEAAFGAQPSLSHIELRSVKGDGGGSISPDLLEPADPTRLLALESVHTRGYSLQCARDDQAIHIDAQQPEPHGHSLKMWSDK